LFVYLCLRPTPYFYSSVGAGHNKQVQEQINSPVFYWVWDVTTAFKISTHGRRQGGGIHGF